MQNTIKRKQLQFKDDKFTYHVQIIYDSSKFGYGDKSFWKIRLFRVNDDFLTPPIHFQYIQSRGWQQQSKKFKEHSYHCSTRRKILPNKTNLYPLVKEQIVYQYRNREAILKYETKVNNFDLRIEQKYQPELDLLKEQKRQLKLRLKSSEIDNKQYQKLYTPIRKNRDSIEHYIWDVCGRFKGRYFYCGRLKEIYRCMGLLVKKC